MKKSPIIIAFLLCLLAMAACHKDKEMDIKEAIVSHEEITVSATQAQFSWQVDFVGQFQTGVELSQNESMTDLRCVEATKEEDCFVAVADSLTEGKKYYYRIVVWNKFGSYEQPVGDFTTSKTFSIHVSAEPSIGGTVTGGGTFAEGDTCTVVAIANTGYNFVNWTENGTQVSTEVEYPFAVTGNRDLVAHFTSQEYTITATADPEEGGVVEGSGGYNYGDECTLTATANDGYDFVNWTENGTVVSAQASYSFTVTGDRTLVANFARETYTISVSAGSGGSAYVGDTPGTLQSTFTYGQACTVHAVANSGYTFAKWIEDDNIVHTNASYTFTVTSNRTLMANFSEQPQGAINGLFTVNDNGDQVYFSKGNLQYIGSASTPYWKFADNQWDYFGTTTGQNSTNQNVDRDLFGWGTSGYHDSDDPYNVNYQPWSTSGFYDTVNMSYNRFGYGPSTNMPSPNLTGSSAEYDWGIHDSISGTTGSWRTLTGWTDFTNTGEWYYVFIQRTTSSGIRYAKAQVNNVNGVILLPDDWSDSYYSLSSTNTSSASYTSNTITVSQWNTLELHGAVFLPAAGYRGGTSVVDVGSIGNYWSASYCGSDFAFFMDLRDTYLTPSGGNNRCGGRSVRLVCPAE